jgi:HKD family nuclease
MHTRKKPSVAMILAHAYVSTNQIDAASTLLPRLNNKMKCAINYVSGHTKKAAFFEHHSKVITEAKTAIVFA